MNKEDFSERVIRIYVQYHVTNLLNSKITIIIKRSFRESQLNNTNDSWELWPNSTPKRSHKSYTTDCSLMYILWYPLVEIDNVLSTLSEKIERYTQTGNLCILTSICKSSFFNLYFSICAFLAVLDNITSVNDRMRAWTETTVILQSATTVPMRM